jgi:hypothetical protein
MQQSTFQHAAILPNGISHFQPAAILVQVEIPAVTGPYGSAPAESFVGVLSQYNVPCCISSLLGSEVVNLTDDCVNHLNNAWVRPISLVV